MESTLQLFIRYKTQKTTCWTYSKCHRSVIFYIISWMFTYTSVFAWILFLYINISILFVYIVHNHQFHTLIFFCLFISRPLCSTSEVLFSPTHHTHYLFWQHSSVHRSFLFFFLFPCQVYRELDITLSVHISCQESWMRTFVWSLVITFPRMFHPRLTTCTPSSWSRFGTCDTAGIWNDVNRSQTLKHLYWAWNGLYYVRIVIDCCNAVGLFSVFLLTHH